MTRKGIPVFISESGATEASGDGKIDPESEEQWIQLCERLGVSWICWSISDKNESCSMLLPRANATGPWPDDVIKVYGKLVKGLLEKYNDKRKKRRPLGFLFFYTFFVLRDKVRS